jgi:tetratricopeptide (TPR) repeat protein
MLMNKQNKLSRRNFLRGIVKRMKFEHLEEEQISGLNPTLASADQALKQGNYVHAARLYTQYLEKEPAHLEALQKAGYSYFRLGEMNKARNYWSKVLEIRPKNNFAVLYMGLSFAREGKLQDAIQMWQSYFNINQPLIQREINVTLALYEAGEKLDAEEVAANIEKAIQRQKNNSS